MTSLYPPADETRCFYCGTTGVVGETLEPKEVHPPGITIIVCVSVPECDQRWLSRYSTEDTP